VSSFISLSAVKFAAEAKTKKAKKKKSAFLEKIKKFA
jgi:hypothetical protein